MQAEAKMTYMDGELLVKAYKQNGSRLVKEKIIGSYAPMVKHVIGRFNVTYSNTLSQDDLYQYGVLGLLKALDRYDVELEVPFKSYAYKRIHGEVVDALRKEGMLGRDKYEQVKKLENTIQDLTAQLGYEPSAEEVCLKLGISENDYHSTLNTAQLTYMTSLNTKISDGEGEFIYKIDTLVDETQLTPEQILVQSNLKERLREVIEELPEREKVIMALYFYEELTLADIGRVIGVSEARISQILSKTLVQIKLKIQ